MPRRGERPGLRLAVADDAGDDQIGVVERHAVGMREAVAKLAAFVDRAWRFWRDVTADVSRKGELLEELLHPFRVLALVRIDLGVRALEIRRAQHAWRPVARSGHENHVEVVLDDALGVGHGGEPVGVDLRLDEGQHLDLVVARTAGRGRSRGPCGRP